VPKILGVDENPLLKLLAVIAPLQLLVPAPMANVTQSMYACNKAMKVLGMIKRTIRYEDESNVEFVQITGYASR